MQNLLTLRPETWLDDIIINFYFKDIESRGNIGHDCILYNSFFMTNLVDDDEKYDFSKVTRFVKPEMFKKKKIILPINLHNNHWAIGVVDIKMKIIKYLDSKHNDGDLYVKALLQFVHDAWNMFYQDATLPFNNQWKTIPFDDRQMVMIAAYFVVCTQNVLQQIQH